ncbi:MAG: spore cortex biosynthesis protein YabQ [Clostridia bacterium]|nr:spore cortex biosynthesis protein YabQ [Clostridia bacterium]
MFTDTIAWQLYSAFLCGGMGLLWGLHADLLAVWRQIANSRKWVVVLQDIWWMLSGAAVFFLLSLTLTGGRMRWYLFLGCGIGYLCWRQTAGRIFVPAAVRVVRWVAKIFRPLGRVLRRLSEKTKIPIKKAEFSCKKLLHSFCASLYNKLDYYVHKRKEGDVRGKRSLSAAEEKEEHLSAHRSHRIRPVRRYGYGAVGAGNSGERGHPGRHPSIQPTARDG